MSVTNWIKPLRVWIKQSLKKRLNANPLHWLVGTICSILLIGFFTGIFTDDWVAFENAEHFTMRLIDSILSIVIPIHSKQEAKNLLLIINSIFYYTTC